VKRGEVVLMNLRYQEVMNLPIFIPEAEYSGG
jgi:hypothetical protein